MTHLVTHLTVQGVIPPLDQPLPQYEVPDRDLSVLQGWGAERNRKLGVEKGGSRKHRRDKNYDDDGDDDEPVPATTDAAPFSSAMVPPPPPGSDVVRPSDMHLPQFERDNTSTSDSLQFGANRTTGMEVDMGFNYGTGPTSLPSVTGVTPDNIASISPMDMIDSNNSQALTSYQGGIFGLLSGGRPSASPNAITPVPVNMADSLGSQDPRPNIVKRGLIPNNEALSLVH